MDPLPDSQVALERQLRTGEVHGRIQGKNKEYTEGNFSPLHSNGAIFVSFVSGVDFRINCITADRGSFKEIRD